MSSSRSQPTSDCRTLWIGDIEPWMDEAYITSLFQGLGILINFLYKAIANVTNVKLIKDRVVGLPDGNKQFKC